MTRSIFIGLVGLMAVMMLVTVGEVQAKNKDGYAVIAMIGNSGVENMQLEQSKQILVARIGQLGKLREFREAPVEVISGATGTTLWSGTPDDIVKGKRVKGLLGQLAKNPNMCSNLVAAFRRLNNRIRQFEVKKYKKIYVFIHAGLIHTGVPCGNLSSLPIPQLPPAKINFEKIFHRKSIASLIFMGVNEWQEEPWNESLEETGMYAAQHGMIFDFKGEAQTHAFLEEGFRSWIKP